MDQKGFNPKNAALAYIPFIFLYTAKKYANEEFYMAHSKMGALSTLLLFIPLITAAFISELIGGIFYGLYFVFLGFCAYKARKGQRIENPILNSLAAKIPLEIFKKHTQAPPPEPQGQNKQ